MKEKDKPTLTDTLLIDTLFPKQEVVVSFVSGWLAAVLTSSYYWHCSESSQKLSQSADNQQNESYGAIRRLLLLVYDPLGWQN